MATLSLRTSSPAANLARQIAQSEFGRQIGDEVELREGAESLLLEVFVRRRRKAHRATATRMTKKSEPTVGYASGEGGGDDSAAGGELGPPNL